MNNTDITITLINLFIILYEKGEFMFLTSLHVSAFIELIPVKNCPQELMDAIIDLANTHQELYPLVFHLIIFTNLEYKKIFSSQIHVFDCITEEWSIPSKDSFVTEETTSNYLEIFHAQSNNSQSSDIES